ncbi:hypothetical protein J6590_064671 [Homalodisca vitripennis]|nr:hypothetical protein J6590_064671 [Homalodisca vitripennis]
MDLPSRWFTFCWIKICFTFKDYVRFFEKSLLSRVTDSDGPSRQSTSGCFTHRDLSSILKLRRPGEVRAKKPSLTLNLGTNGLKVTSEPPPMAGQAGRLQGQDRSAVTCPSSRHARRCLIWLSCDNRRTHYTAPLAIERFQQCRGIYTTLRELKPPSVFL